jgi:Putative transposase
VRKGVLSLAFELRHLAAFRADVARALGRIFIEAVALEQKREANIAGSQHAAANHIQRFGGSLNLNLHFHAIIADGVFAPDGAGQIRFHSLAPPTQDMLERVVRRVRDRALRWLRKRGLLDERFAEERGNEQPERGALDACAEVALRGGAFAVIAQRDASRSDNTDARFEPKKRGPFTAERDGFDIQAAVRIEADDDDGRERLVR